MPFANVKYHARHHWRLTLLFSLGVAIIMGFLTIPFARPEAWHSTGPFTDPGQLLTWLLAGLVWGVIAGAIALVKIWRTPIPES